MSKIEDLVIFKNEKELSETEKSIEKIFGISFQSYVRRLEIGLDAEGLSHDDDSAVAHILADMGKKDSILWIFCKNTLCKYDWLCFGVIKLLIGAASKKCGFAKETFCMDRG